MWALFSVDIWNEEQTNEERQAKPRRALWGGEESVVGGPQEPYEEVTRVS